MLKAEQEITQNTLRSVTRNPATKYFPVKTKSEQLDVHIFIDIERKKP